MSPEAALDLEAFTPKVVGTTKVWNFHSENSFQLGFYLMVLAVLTITFLPAILRWLQRHLEQRRQGRVAASSMDSSKSIRDPRTAT